MDLGAGCSVHFSLMGGALYRKQMTLNGGPFSSYAVCTWPSSGIQRLIFTYNTLWVPEEGDHLLTMLALEFS